MAETVSVREQARKTAARTRARLRAEQAERERQRDKLAEGVIVELAQRDAAVARAEGAAGRALEQMITGLGLGVSEVAEWCGGLSAKEIGRLRNAARGSAGGAT